MVAKSGAAGAELVSPGFLRGHHVGGGLGLELPVGERLFDALEVAV